MIFKIVAFETTTFNTGGFKDQNIIVGSIKIYMLLIS